MIVLGIILFVIGIFMYYGGTEQNSSLESQWESFFENGKTDPGDTLIFFGTLFMIAGIIVFIVGIVKYYNENAQNEGGASNGGAGAAVKPPVTKTCRYCGSTITDECVYCPKCGKENSNFKYCPKCSQRVDEDSMFCFACGFDFLFQKFSLNENTSENEIIACAFNLIEKGKFNDAHLLLNSSKLANYHDPKISLGKLLIQYGLCREEYLERLGFDFSVSEKYAEIMKSNDEDLKNRISVYLDTCRKDIAYKKACTMMEIDNKEAKLMFESLGDWRDSKEMLMKCKSNDKVKFIALSIMIIVIFALLFLLIAIS